MDAELDTLVPADPQKPYDVKDVIKRVVDRGDFFEVHERFARNIVVGFARLDGHVITSYSIHYTKLYEHSVSAHLLVKVSKKQRLLEIESAAERLRMVGEMLATELEIVKLERKIKGQVRSQVHKNQKEFYLNEQLKAIRKELSYNFV